MRKLGILFFITFILFLASSNSVFANKVVQTNQVYTYEMMEVDIKQLKEKYPHLMSYESIGKTPFGREIWAVKIGNGKGNVFINGSHHAREWISTVLVMNMMEYYLQSYEANAVIDGYSARDVLNEMSIWFVPMVNPDGVTLQQKGLNAFPKEYHESLIRMNEGKRDFTRWKANAQGIDLNRQYPANWYSPTFPLTPSWQNYKGKAPFQAAESKAIRDLTYRIKPEMAISYHSSGRVIFWHFHNKKENMNRDLRLAKALSNKTGYPLISPQATPSGKGYTDWFIQQFSKPAFTPELAPYVGDRHVPLSYYSEIWRRNDSVGLWAAAEGYDLHHKTKQTKKLNERIRLNEKSYLYHQPSLTKNSGSALNPQTVQAIEQFNNWYKIETYLGHKWVLIENNLENFPERTFIDVPKQHWAKENIDFVFEKGWLTGVSEQSYSPNTNVTRAQMAAILTRILNIPTTDLGENEFTDVPENHWAYEEILAVKNYKLFVGFEDHTFRPNEPISRAEMAAVFTRLSGYETQNVIASIPFKDVPANHWARNEIALMKELNIFSGISKDEFGIHSNTLRSEIAALLTRIAMNYPTFFDFKRIIQVEEEVIEDVDETSNIEDENDAETEIETNILQDEQAVVEEEVLEESENLVE